jgi:hypothetical protein
VTIEDDEARLKNLEFKIELNERALARVRSDLRELGRRERFGVLNSDQRKELLDEVAAITERLDERREEYDTVLSTAGLRPKGDK